MNWHIQLCPYNKEFDPKESLQPKKELVHQMLEHRESVSSNQMASE